MVYGDPSVIVACITSAGALLAIVLASLLSQRNQRAQRGALNEQQQKISEIHILVNSKMDDALKRIAQLEAKLGLSAGEDIPNPAIITTQTEKEEP